MKRLRIWLIKLLWLWKDIPVEVGFVEVKDDEIPSKPDDLIILNEFVITDYITNKKTYYIIYIRKNA